MQKPLIAAGMLAATLAGGSLAYAQQPPAPSSPPADAGSPPSGVNPLIMGGPAAGRAMQEQMIEHGPPQGATPPGGPPAGANPLIMGGPAAGRAMQEGMIGAPTRHGPHPMMMGGGEEGREMEEGMMHMHPPKGAVFMFRRGDQRVMIKCADDEPTKACVDGAGALLDKLGGASGNSH